MKPRAEKDKNYEERHREERKAKSLVWGTSVPRKQAEEINAFLMKNDRRFISYNFFIDKKHREYHRWICLCSQRVLNIL